MNFYILFAIFQIAAIVCLVNATTKPLPEEHPAVGDVYNKVVAEDQPDMIVQTMTVLAVKNGYVQYRTTYWRPSEEPATIIAELKRFLFGSTRVIPKTTPVFDAPTEENKP